jgi:hypothetical protein
MSGRAERAKARNVMQKKIAKRGGCAPRLKGDCGKGACLPRKVFVNTYTVASGKYAGTKRDQYCRRGRISS